MQPKPMILAIVFVMASEFGFADETPRYRDFAVERPLAAGVLKGLSLGAFGDGAFGKGRVVASEHDPYGMTEAAYQSLVRHGRTGHTIGLLIGVGTYALLAFGLVNTTYKRWEIQRYAQ